MLQDIAPHKYYVAYERCKPSKGDILLIFRDDTVLVREERGVTEFPVFGEVKAGTEPVFLFRIDDTRLFMAYAVPGADYEGWQFVRQEYFRNAYPMWKAFAGAEAMRLYRWYGENRFCSRCGKPLVRGSRERSLVCLSCGKTIYPSIAPCVIVALTDGDRLLLTRYSKKHSKYNRYALVAGYTEIGETFEDTVRREVMEEVGLKVKNITYYKNQPWPFTDTILMGFFAELDSSGVIKRDEDELSEAVWLERGDIPECGSEISLTNEMIEKFRCGK